MKRVYTFGDGKAEGNAEMRNLLGGKGCQPGRDELAGYACASGFTITTEVCNEYTQYGKDEVVNRIKAEVEEAIKHVESLTATSSTIRRIPCLFQCVQVPALPCPV